MTWVWLSAPEIDFGGASPGRLGDERVVWLHADPFRALDLPHSASSDAVRDAFRRLAREHHPDVSLGQPESLRRFQDAQHAVKTINGQEEITIEPTSGQWWRFVGFLDAPLDRSSEVVAGLTFEIRDLQKVPLSQAEDRVRISYAGHVLPLEVRYTGADPRSLCDWRTRRLPQSRSSSFCSASSWSRSLQPCWQSTCS